MKSLLSTALPARPVKLYALYIIVTSAFFLILVLKPSKSLLLVPLCRLQILHLNVTLMQLLMMHPAGRASVGEDPLPARVPKDTLLPLPLLHLLHVKDNHLVLGGACHERIRMSVLEPGRLHVVAHLCVHYVGEVN